MTIGRRFDRRRGVFSGLSRDQDAIEMAAYVGEEIADAPTVALVADHIRDFGATFAEPHPKLDRTLDRADSALWPDYVWSSGRRALLFDVRAAAHARTFCLHDSATCAVT